MHLLAGSVLIPISINLLKAKVAEVLSLHKCKLDSVAESCALSVRLYVYVYTSIDLLWNLGHAGLIVVTLYHLIVELILPVATVLQANRYMFRYRRT